MPPAANPVPSRPVAPRSATHPAVAAAGAAGCLVAVVLVMALRPFGHDTAYSALLVVAVTASCVFLPDLLWQKVYRRASTGLDFAIDAPSWSRTLTKCVGLVATLLLVACAYRWIPEYGKSLYDPFWRALRIAVPAWLVLAVPYLHFVDRHMRAPRDGYWQMGALVMLRFRDVERRALAQHLLGWAIKGYFIALMGSYFCADLRWLFLFDFSTLTQFAKLHEFLFRAMYMLDVALAVLGYAMSLRIADTQLRSADATLFGWLVTLACYEPFWTLVTYRVVPFDKGLDWAAWLVYHPALYVAWGSAILVLNAVYVWATIMFGARFSNLTNRGIVTAGPYRFTRHPAYLAKNLSWWMMFVPFLPSGSIAETIGRCLMLLGVNVLYGLRAYTEERHLSRDAEYVHYALWIDAHGPLRFLHRLPLMRRFRFRAPVATS